MSEQKQVYARNISIEYGYEDDFKNSDLFTVRECEANLLMEHIILLIDEYNFTNFRVSLGEKYLTSKNNACTKSQIDEYLITNFDALKDQRVSLKLTK